MKIFFTADSADAQPLVSARATCTPTKKKGPKRSAAGATSPITVKKLAAKRAYVCTVAVADSVGFGAESAGTKVKAASKKSGKNKNKTPKGKAGKGKAGKGKAGKGKKG